MKKVVIEAEMDSSGHYDQKRRHSQCGLEDVVLSWSLQDIFNKRLYKDKVEKIPETFSSVNHYLESFVYPLIEETHADMSSSMIVLSQAPTCEISDLCLSKNYKPPKSLLYDIEFSFQKDGHGGREIYEPKAGDVIALSNIKPVCISDLNRPPRAYLPALVLEARDEYHPTTTILASKLVIDEKEGKKKKEESLFAVFLINITTNMRIWKALRGGNNMNLIKQVLHSDSNIRDSCDLCSSLEVCTVHGKDLVAELQLLNMNESQIDAVISSIATSFCHHRNSIKLIWGPPGTGKTKTVGALLWALLEMKCRTITCAPTNIAIMEVISRLLMLVRNRLRHNCYGLGDIVLLGNKKRMKIDDHDGLFDVFLDYRVDILSQCFNPVYGWPHHLNSMIWFLEDPKSKYNLYLENARKIKEEKKDCTEKSKRQSKIKEVKHVQFEKNKYKKTGKKEHVKKYRRGRSKKIDKDLVDNEVCEAEDGTSNNVLTLLEFTTEQLIRGENGLRFCIKNLCKHLPTCFISVTVVETMNNALYFLESLRKTLNRCTNEELWKIFIHSDRLNCESSSPSLLNTRWIACLQILRRLRQMSIVPRFSDIYSVRKVCMDNALLIFCTVSSSAMLHKTTPSKMLVVDEAAQLKECEAAVPLQLPGVRHAVLIGDEHQLPATIKSQISADAKLGRSLFQRLASLGWNKNLLKIQYRMHPSISLFPNSEFYNNQISDGSNVLKISYQKHLLKGDMYGSYSFINVGYGREQFDDYNSWKNMVEVAVVSEIVARLYRASTAKNEKVSVGVISPYKAQVFALKAKVENKYVKNKKFSVCVRSVDGFQGGEEDVIILSTVRSNGDGSVGFLSNRQRTNVALTRARYCLWILGNGSTLVNSSSVWKNLVLDAKNRGFFFSAENDNKLAEAITDAMIDLGQFDDLLNYGSLLLREARWKVVLGKDFFESFMRIWNVETKKKVLHLLKKLSSGWRQPFKGRRNLNILGGASSELLEPYKVHGLLYLLWTVDILKEGTKQVQVLKFWDILQFSEIPKLARCLDIIFENYTVDHMNHCKFKHVEGKLEIPMNWEIDTVSASSSNAHESQVIQLSSKLASLNLGRPEQEKKIAKQMRKDPAGVWEKKNA